MKLTKAQAVRIAYECARDFRDIAGGCGGVGAPWEDLTPQQKQNAEGDYDIVFYEGIPQDKLFILNIRPLLQALVE